MGLFSKKAKPPKPGTHKAKPEERGDQQPAAPQAAAAAGPEKGKPGKPGKPEKPGKPGKPPKPPKPPKLKRGAIDSTDFIALKTELADVRARLEATEQAKSIVESRLAALDATTTAMSAGALGADDLRTRVHSLEAQLEAVADTASAATVTAEAAAAKATTAATVATEAVTGVSSLAANPPAVPVPDPSPRLADLEVRIARLAADQAAIQTAVTAAPSPVPASGPDPDTIARIEALAVRVAQVDQFAAQLSQLNARVTAQAELGAQLGSLRDRLAELQNGQSEQTDRRAAAVAATEEADLRDRVNTLADRMAATDSLVNQIGQLAERVAANDTAVRESTEQVSVIERRLDSVATELANQISELGRDIDGLAEQPAGTGGAVISDEVIDSLRTAQVRLAQEQARYEIAFRQDLAALAEQVLHRNG